MRQFDVVAEPDLGNLWRGRGVLRTSPPPTTSTFLPLICQARMRLPPPWTSGNRCFSEPMLPVDRSEVWVVLLVCWGVRE